MVAPLIVYGNIVYSGTSYQNLDKLQKLQNRDLRICTNESQNYTTDQLHQHCMVPSLSTRVLYNLRKYMYKHKNNIKLVVQREIRTRRYDAVIYETCRPNLEKYKKKGAIYRGVLEWNNMDINIRNIETFCEFKTAQKQWMLDSIL